MAKKVTYHHWKNGLLLCTKCKKYIEKDNFTTNPQRQHDREGRHPICRDCCKINAKDRRNTIHKDSLDKLLKERLNSLKERCKTKGWVTDITLEYLEYLLNYQDFKCAISGIQMTHFIGDGRVATNISVDRKDNTIGYIKGNVQLVCTAVNQMKNDLPMDTLIYFCKQIIDNYES